LLLNAERATENPLKTMNEIVMEEQGSDTSTDELFECEESGSTYQATCSKRLEIDIEVIPEIKESIKFCDGHSEEVKEYTCCNTENESYYWTTRTIYCNPGCQSKTVIKQHKSVRVTREEWIDDCGPLEKLSESGFCAYGTKEVGGQETRTIQGEPVTRPSWFEGYTYVCKKQPSVSCDALKAKRCQQVDSKCLEFVNGVCVLWRYTYKCSSANTQKMKTYKSGGGSPFCFTGNCADTSYPVNSDMMDAFSQMAILKQVQEYNKNNIGIFKGDVRHCSKNCLDFKDCCGGNGGWGVDIGLSSCSEDEKLLSQLRQKNLCVELGEYCAETIDLGFTEVCLRKKRGHCCFGSKLSKTIQEQGRRQLGLDFGSAEHPNCRALTADELSRLDFSKMDLTPLYDDISQKMKIPDQGHMAKGIELDRIRDNMKLLTSNQTRKN
jgi:type-F conjugative transfer system mating-pair stabilization protein TraN